ncbi:aromatic acid exporter family protein [Comamonas testosteroni]|uniref:Aromatic acid exporter family protein n=1 Tax=Comamonas testosteroni TaxID=285 RepID=A0A373FSN0_COMTE|nr:aromatic acid exporter family protein [Comamonas testosteroni]
MLAWRRTRTTLPTRARLAARDAIAAALASACAWLLAQRLWGHTHPAFAVVTAVLCLAPGLPSHLKQARSLLIGCTLGIVIGDLLWQLPDQHMLLRLSAGIFIAVLLGAVIGPVPVVPIQSGVSVVLVLAMGPAAAGSARLLDVLVGAAVGLVFSQVLFTSNPIKDMGSAASIFLKQVANGLDLILRACQEQKADAAEAALGQLSLAHESLAALRAAVGQAHSSRRWTLRGRLNAERLAFVTRRYDRHALRVYATALLLAESLNRAASHTHQPPPEPLSQYCRWLIEACQDLARQPTVVALKSDDPLATLAERAESDAAPLSAEWQPVHETAQQLENALRALIGSRDA